MLSPILNAINGQWTIGRIENHTAKPLSGPEIEAHIAEYEQMKQVLAATEVRNREMNELLAALPARIADEMQRRANTP